jgi:Domain of unknown function (DUF4395)
MAQNINITCPVSPDRINEYVARVAAFYVIALSIVGLITSSWLLFLVLAIDFALRSFTSGDSSPIRRVSKATAQALGLGQKPTDAAPKKFAAGVGFAFAATIAVLLALQLPTAALAVAAVLLLCAALEGFLGFCVGCVVYSVLVAPFLNKFR